MPTSNGQVGSRDIRQAAIKTVHIVDEAVTTPKIPDLAVTFPDKLDDPIWSTGFYESLWSNETLVDGVFSSWTTTLDVPAWIDSVTVIAIATAGIVNTSGSDNLLSISILIDGNRRSVGNHEAINNQSQIATIAYGADLSGVAGSSVSVGIEVLVQGANSTSNAGRISGVLIGRR